MNPSYYAKIKPWSSVFQKSEHETVAQNIMKILERTGNTFRKLSYEEYKTERLKDVGFTNSEEMYFYDVLKYTLSSKNATNFSKDWK